MHEEKDVSSGNYKSLMKGIKDDLHEWKDIHVHGSGDLILLKCPYCPTQPKDSM